MKLNELVNFSKDDKETKTAPEKELKEQEVEEDEHVDRTTKIKVIVAVMVVGFAAYVAWWVQEPGAVRADQMVSTVESTDTLQTEQMTQEISFSGFALDPAEVHVEKGTTVIWTNKDTVPHTVTGSIFTSGTLDRGQSYSFTFTEDGTYDYFCSFHKQITGKIIVGSGGDTQQTEDLGLLTGSEELLPDATTDLFPAAGETLTTMDAGDISTLDGINADMADTGVTSLSDETLLTGDTGALDAIMPPANLDAELSESTAETDAELHSAAVKSDKLASSGPEDFLYAGAFAVILFLNRRKLLGAVK